MMVNKIKWNNCIYNYNLPEGRGKEYDIPYHQQDRSAIKCGNKLELNETAFL